MISECASCGALNHHFRRPSHVPIYDSLAAALGRLKCAPPPSEFVWKGGGARAIVPPCVRPCVMEWPSEYSNNIQNEFNTAPALYFPLHSYTHFQRYSNVAGVAALSYLHWPPSWRGTGWTAVWMKDCSGPADNQQGRPPVVAGAPGGLRLASRPHPVPRAAGVPLRLLRHRQVQTRTRSAGRYGPAAVPTQVAKTH